MASFGFKKLEDFHFEESEDDDGEVLEGERSMSTYEESVKSESESESISSGNSSRDVMSDEDLAGVRSFFYPLRGKGKKSARPRSEKIEKMIKREINNFNEGRKVGKHLDKIERVMTRSTRGGKRDDLEGAMQKHSMVMETLKHLRKIQTREADRETCNAIDEKKESQIHPDDVENLNVRCMNSYEKEVNECRKQIACLTNELKRNKSKTDQSKALENRCQQLSDRINELESVVFERETALNRMKNKLGEQVSRNSVSRKELAMKKLFDEYNEELSERRKELEEKEKSFLAMKSRYENAEQRRQRNKRIYKSVQKYNRQESKGECKGSGENDAAVDLASCNGNDTKINLKNDEEIIDVLKTDMDQMKSEFKHTATQLSNKVKIAKRRYKDSEVEKSKLEDTLGCIKIDCSSLQQNLQDTTKENAKLKKDLAQTLKDRDLLKAKVKSIERDGSFVGKSGNGVTISREQHASFEFGKDVNVNCSKQHETIATSGSNTSCFLCVSSREEMGKLAAENKRLHEGLPKLDALNLNLAEIAEKAVEKQSQLQQENIELRKTIMGSQMNQTNSMHKGAQSCSNIGIQTAIEYCGTELSKDQNDVENNKEGADETASIICKGTGRSASCEQSQMSADTSVTSRRREYDVAFAKERILMACNNSNTIKVVKEIYEFENYVHKTVRQESEEMRAFSAQIKEMQKNLEMDRQREAYEREIMKMRSRLRDYKDVVKQKSELDMKLSNVAAHLEETLENEEKARKEIKKLKRQLKLGRLRNVTSNQSVLKDGESQEMTRNASCRPKEDVVGKEEKIKDSHCLPVVASKDEMQLHGKVPSTQAQKKKMHKKQTRSLPSEEFQSEMQFHDHVPSVQAQKIQKYQRQVRKRPSKGQETRRHIISSTSTEEDLHNTESQEKLGIQLAGQDSRESEGEKESWSRKLLDVTSSDDDLKATIEMKVNVGKSSVILENDLETDTYEDEAKKSKCTENQVNDNENDLSQIKAARDDVEKAEKEIIENKEVGAGSKSSGSDGIKNEKPFAEVRKKVSFSDEEQIQIKGTNDVMGKDDSGMSLRHDTHKKKRKKSSFEKLMSRFSWRSKSKGKSRAVERELKDSDESDSGVKSSCSPGQSDSQTSLMKVQCSGVMRKDKYKEKKGGKKKRLFRLAKLLPRMSNSGSDKSSQESPSVEEKAEKNQETENVRKSKTLPSRYMRNRKYEDQRNGSQCTAKQAENDSSSLKSSDRSHLSVENSGKIVEHTNECNDRKKEGQSQSSNNHILNDQSSKDRGLNDQGSNDQGSSDQSSNGCISNNHILNDQSSNDRGLNDQSSYERISNDHISSDQSSNDQGLNDRGLNDQGPKDQSSNDRISNDHISSDHTPNKQSLVDSDGDKVVCRETVLLSQGKDDCTKDDNVSESHNVANEVTEALGSKKSVNQCDNKDANIEPCSSASGNLGESSLKKKRSSLTSGFKLKWKGFGLKKKTRKSQAKEAEDDDGSEESKNNSDIKKKSKLKLANIGGKNAKNENTITEETRDAEVEESHEDDKMKKKIEKGDEIERKKKIQEEVKLAKKKKKDEKRMKEKNSEENTSAKDEKKMIKEQIKKGKIERKNAKEEKKQLKLEMKYKKKEMKNEMKIKLKEEKEKIKDEEKKAKEFNAECLKKKKQKEKEEKKKRKDKGRRNGEGSLNGGGNRQEKIPIQDLFAAQPQQGKKAEVTVDGVQNLQEIVKQQTENVQENDIVRAPITAFQTDGTKDDYVKISKNEDDACNKIESVVPGKDHPVARPAMPREAFAVVQENEVCSEIVFEPVVAFDYQDLDSDASADDDSVAHRKVDHGILPMKAACKETHGILSSFANVAVDSNKKSTNEIIEIDADGEEIDKQHMPEFQDKDATIINEGEVVPFHQDSDIDMEYDHIGRMNNRPQNVKVRVTPQIHHKLNLIEKQDEMKLDLNLADDGIEVKASQFMKRSPRILNDDRYIESIEKKKIPSPLNEDVCTGQNSQGPRKTTSEQDSKQEELLDFDDQPTADNRDNASNAEIRGTQESYKAMMMKDNVCTELEMEQQSRVEAKSNLSESIEDWGNESNDDSIETFADSEIEMNIVEERVKPDAEHKVKQNVTQKITPKSAWDVTVSNGEDLKKIKSDTKVSALGKACMEILGESSEKIEDCTFTSRHRKDKACHDTVTKAVERHPRKLDEREQELTEEIIALRKENERLNDISSNRSFTSDSTEYEKSARYGNEQSSRDSFKRAIIEAEGATKSAEKAREIARAEKAKKEELKERLSESLTEIEQLKREMRMQSEKERIKEKEYQLRIEEAESCRGIFDWEDEPKSEVEELKVELSVTNLKVRDQEEQLKEYEMKLRDYEKDIERYKEESNELKLLENLKTLGTGQSLETLRERVSELEINEHVLCLREEELVKCREEINFLRASETTLKERLEELELLDKPSSKREEEALSGKELALKKQLEDMEMRLISMEAGDSHEIEIAEMNAKLEVSRERMEVLQAENEKLKSEATKKNASSEELNRYEREIKDLRKRTTTLETEKRALLGAKRLELATAARKQDEKDNMVNSLQTKIEKLKKDASDGTVNKDEAKMLKEQNEVLKRENEALSNDVGRLQSQLDSRNKTPENLQDQSVSDTSDDHMPIQYVKSSYNWQGDLAGCNFTQEQPEIFDDVIVSQFGTELETETLHLGPNEFNFAASEACKDESKTRVKEVKDGCNGKANKEATTLASKAVNDLDPFSPISLLRRDIFSRPRSLDPDPLRDSPFGRR